MKMSERGIKLLSEWEGYKKLRYKDSAGKWTIGVGHLLTDQELQTGRIKIGEFQVGVMTKPLTDEEVRELLAQDLVRFEKAVNETVKVKLNQDQFDALVSFAFNIGVGAFKSGIGVVRDLNLGRYHEVPNQLRKWNKAGGKIIKGLVNRREKEISLWNSEV